MTTHRTSSAFDHWSALEAPWREAFQAGGVGVGAVLTDSTGQVIGRGRNQRFSTGSAGALLAHAYTGLNDTQHPYGAHRA